MNDHPIEIHALLPADVHALQELSRQTFWETYAASNSMQDMQQYMTEHFSIPRLTDMLRHKDSVFYASFCDSKITGYIKINFHQEQTEWKYENGCEIERIYVRQPFQGYGIGAALLEKALDNARQRAAAYIWLGVWEHNRKAIRFYERNGFTAVGTHVFRLGTDEQTDILMKRLLMK